MAAMVTAIPVTTSAQNVVPTASVAQEDDEQFLYGENSEKKTSKENGDNESEQKVNGNAENVNEDDDEYEDSDDDDDDDHIQVTIGEVNTSAPNQYGTPGAWKKDAPATTAAAAAAVPGSKPGTAVGQGQKKIDVNAVGSINGQPIYEFDIDANEEEKAWRKPGADISDYFNYGFTEDTWKLYCEKQRRMRLESSRTPYTVTAAPVVPVAAAPSLEFEVLPDGRTRVKAGPPPDRKVEGSIHVLGTDDLRRKQKEEELLALALGQPRMIQQQPFPGQRPVYTALPGGGMMFNGPDMAGQNPDQGQQIQSIGAPSSMGNVMQPGLSYLPAGAGIPMGAPIFPPPGGLDLNTHGLPPPFGRGNSDSEYDSEGERRHRRRDSGRHSSRRHRDRDRDRSERSDRDPARHRDRDRSSRSDRERSSSRRRHESRSTSDRKKHSRTRDEDDGSERKSSRRRSKVEVKEEPMDDITDSQGNPIMQDQPLETQIPTAGVDE